MERKHLKNYNSQRRKSKKDNPDKETAEKKTTREKKHLKNDNSAKKISKLCQSRKVKNTKTF